MLVTSQVSAALTWGWRREECMLLTDAKRNDTFKKSKSWTMNKATKETNRARDGSKRDKPKVARLSKEILRLEESNRSLLASRNYFQQRCAALEKIISAMNADAIPPRTVREQETFVASFTGTCEKPIVVPTFEEDFLRECLENAKREPNGHRWSENAIRFCYLLRSLGAKSYDFMRNFITLPVKGTLYSHYADVTEAWRTNLLTLTGVQHICQLLRRRHGISGDCPIEIVVGIDAMAMEPVPEGSYGAQKDDNHVFLFQVLPLQCELKPICVHLMTQKGGNAGAAVRERLDMVRKALHDEKFDVQYVATDGDSGYAPMHKKLFDTWWPVYLNTGVEAALDVLGLQETRILTDFLHILKNARSRIINGVVTLTYNGAKPFSADEMESVLRIGKPLLDKSPTGKMKDSYALSIFTLENFFTLLHHGHPEMAFYILPYTLWACVVREPLLSTQMRRDLVVLCIQIFQYHWYQFGNLTPDVSENKKTKNFSSIQFCCSQQHVIRVLNTLMGLLREFTRHPDNLALSRMGTHDLECQFGVVRILCHYKHSWKMILKCFSKLTVIKDLTTLFGCPLNPRERVNFGGIKIQGDKETFYQSSAAINMLNVMEGVNLILSLGNEMDDSAQDLVAEVDGEVRKLTEYLEFVMNLHNQTVGSEMRMYPESDVAHSSILARLISFVKTSSEPTTSQPDEQPEQPALRGEAQ